MNRFSFIRAVPVALALPLLAAGGSALASDDEFYKEKNCIACHRVDRNGLGPSFKNIAAKHAGDATAEARLAQKIRAGGSGVWGPVPMPAQPQVNEEEALRLARWILTLK